MPTKPQRQSHALPRGIFSNTSNATLPGESERKLIAKRKSSLPSKILSAVFLFGLLSYGCANAATDGQEKCPDGDTANSINFIQDKIIKRYAESANPTPTAPVAFATFTVGATPASFVQVFENSNDPVIKALLLQLKACQGIQKKIDESGAEFAGIKFGIGLALTNTHGNSITNAQVIDGVVRVLKEQSNTAGLMLESHYFVHVTDWKEKIDSDMGIGPFVALRLADVPGGTKNGSFGAFGAGLMVGFRKSATSQRSYNIGIGYFADTQVKELGSGVVEGKPLPGTETAIRYKEVSKNGWMIMLSSTF